MRQLIKKLAGQYQGIQITELRGTSDEFVKAYSCNCPDCSCPGACDDQNQTASVNANSTQKEEAQGEINRVS